MGPWMSAESWRANCSSLCALPAADMTVTALLALLLCRMCAPSPHRIIDKAGAGATLIATRPIRTGEVIINELPLIALAHSRDNDAYGSNSGTWFQPSDSYVIGLLETQLDKLSDADYKAYYDLFGYCGGMDRASNALDIFRTNAYPLDSNGRLDMAQIISGGSAAQQAAQLPVVHKRSKAGVYKTISRINHSCKPNVCYSFDSPSGCGSIHAIRDIPSGAELLNTYIPLQSPTNERQEYLMKNFGFSCDCSVCRRAVSTSDVYRVQAPNELSQRMNSDERRSELKRLRQEVEQLILQLQSREGDRNEAAISVIDGANYRRMELLRDEDIATPDLLLEVLQSQLCAAVLTGSAGGDNATLQLCSQAHALSVLCRGAQARDTLVLRRLANELRSSDDLSI